MPDFQALFAHERFLASGSFQPLEVPARHVLLCEGAVADRLYFVRQGALRAWFLHEGRERTLQFYFEGAAVSSLESFLDRQPSGLTLESLEPTTLWVLPRPAFEHLLATDADFKEWFYSLVTRRMLAYARQLSSFLRDTPEQRYHALLAEHPTWPQRVPQHYLASYLGITAVSLSRIRNRRHRN